MTNKILNQLFSSCKKWKTLALISMLLTLGVGQMWGATIFNCGIDVNDTWYKGTGTINSGNWLNNKTAFNNANLGVLTSLTLGGQYDTWDNNQTDQCSWNNNNGIHILIKKGSTQKASFKLSCYHDSKDGNNNVWKTSGGTGGCSDSGSWGTYSCDISGYAAGNDYTIKATWTSPSSQSNNATASFTIPGFSTTSTSKAFSSTTVGNNTSETISFTQHYGTALTTSNCAITGTNSGDFSVTNISETGVTVRFAPSAAGSRSATLTITDAHSKTCTITLSGTGVAPAEPTHDVTISYKYNSTTIKDATTESAVGESTSRSITAPTITGYAFSSWTKGAGVNITSGSTSTSTISITTNSSGAYTLQANYTEDLTSPWHLLGANTPFGGWTSSNSNMLRKASGSSTGSVASITINVSALPSAEEYTFKLYNSDTDKWRTNGGYWVTRANNNPTLSTEGGSNNELIFKPDIAGDYVFTLNYSSSNPVLTVTFPTKYTVTYSVSPSGAANAITTSPSVSSGGEVVAGTSVTFTHAAAKTGYSWYRWENGSGSSLGTGSTYNTTITANTTVVAKYTENNYTVTVQAGAGGSVSSGSVTGHVSTKVTLPTATANTGYYFTGWEVTSGTATLASASSATAAKINGMTAAVTVRANFAPIWYLKGDFNSWGEGNPIAMASSTSGSVSLTTTSAKLSNSKFKIYNKQTDKYYQKANQSITRASNTASSGWTEGGTSNDMKFNSDVIGDYTFALTFSSNIPSALTVTYPTAFTITFGKGTGGATITASATSAGGSFNSGDYVASGDNVTFTQTPSSSGYTFKGWYTAASGGSAVATMSSSDNILNSISANANVYAQYTANTYTVSFDKNGGGGATPSSRSVTFGSAYGTLPAGPTPSGADAFVGWYTERTGGTKVTAETIVSTASNHTLYARFESTYTVTVQYKSGDVVLRPQTTTDASESSVAATIIAPVVLGYEFANWSGDNATFADASNDTTTVHVTSATTVVANYNAVPMVYFKNNLDWDSVFVSFNCGWATVGGKQVPTNNGKPYYKMTQLGSSDIFYCRIPSEIVSSWKGNIAFDNKGAFGNYTTTHIGNSNSFWKNEFLGRGDFDSNATMFIPYNGATETRNEGKYYTRGCWIQYNSNYSGYKVRVNTHIQGSGGSEVASVQLTSSVAGATEFTAKVNLSSANYKYGVMLYKDYTTNSSDLWYTNVNDDDHVITSSTTTLPWPFEPCNDAWQRCQVKTEALGDYIFTVSFATGIPMVDIEYPVTVGDFRLVYKDRATWNTTHNASWYQASNVFKKEGNRVDTASFFVSYASSPSVELQKCTAINTTTGAQTWTKQGENISLSSIDSAGVYNFTVTQNNNGSSATGAYLGKYDGKFYIRTDASDGGWNNYQSTENALTYSEYSMSHGGSEGAYSHYYMRHVNNGQNIKFVIANDYSICLTDTLVSDTLANEWIEREANVRFSWNCETNKIARSYISGSSIVSDRFLVLEGDANLFDASGNALNISGLNPNEMNFIDDQNWVYEATVKANPGARIKLTAKFGNKVQYFYGTAGARSDETTYQLIGGTTGGPYKIRVVYDFKTNRLVCAWMPDNNSVDSEFKVEADVMILRYHQGEAQQITFGVNGKLTDVKTVYGTMEFNKYRLNNQLETGDHRNLGLSPYERDLYFISFPFDVKLNDVFGFGTYGKHWIIEYYDGKGRAAKGFWKDSPTNWKFVTKAMKDDFTLKAGEGYVLALDLDQLGFSSSVWSYGVENVYLYFPSTATVDKINATDVTIKIDTTGYYCNINRPTADGDRRVKDSHWHLLGVPSYANANHATGNSWTGSGKPNTPSLDPANWTTSAPYVYEWNMTSNELTIVSTATHTFKAMQAYMAQYARDTIQWRQVNATPQSIAARRNANYKSVYEFNLELQQNGGTLDKTFVNLRDDEEVTGNFDFNYDLCKIMYGANSKPTNIYTLTADAVEVAGNCLPLETEQVTTVPVGVVAKTDGSYTFAMPDGTEGLSVMLYDNQANKYIDLSIEDYTLDLTAGMYDNRFYLTIDPRNSATTIDVVGGEGEDVEAAKIFRNGLLYIQRGDKLYDARGSRIE